MSKCLQPGDMAGSSHHRESAIACGRRRAAAPLGEKDEGRGTRDEGRRTRDEGRRTRDEGRRTNGRAEHSQLARRQDARAPRGPPSAGRMPALPGTTTRGQDARAPRGNRPRAGCPRSQGVAVPVKGGGASRRSDIGKWELGLATLSKWQHYHAAAMTRMSSPHRIAMRLAGTARPTSIPSNRTRSQEPPPAGRMPALPGTTRGQDARAPRDHHSRAGCPRSQGAARGQAARAPREHRPRARCSRFQGSPAGRMPALPGGHRPRARCPRSQGATARGQDARAPRDHPRSGYYHAARRRGRRRHHHITLRTARGAVPTRKRGCAAQ